MISPVRGLLCLYLIDKRLLGLSELEHYSVPSASCRKTERFHETNSVVSFDIRYWIFLLLEICWAGGAFEESYVKHQQ